MKRGDEEKIHHLYLIHGNDETEVNNRRYELVCSLLPADQRDAGLTEFQSAANAPLKLDSIYGELISELGVGSFIADSRRVVVVYDLQDFFEAKRRASAKKATKKTSKAPQKTRASIFTDWISEVLPTTENVAVFVCTENDEKQRRVSRDGELYKLIQGNGRVIECMEKPMNFEFEDRMLAGNGPAAVSILREWLDRIGGNSGGRLKVYSTVAGIIELAIQSKCLEQARLAGIPQTQVSVEGFPSLGRIPSWKADKIHRFAKRFQLGDLRRSLEKINRLQRIMYPTGEEAYIPDWEDYLEMIVMELTLASR